MTTTAIERVPAERIAHLAAETTPKATALLAVTWLFWALGYAVRFVFLGLWKIVIYAWSAARTGWEDCGGPSKRAQITRLEQQLTEALAALERLK